MTDKDTVAQTPPLAQGPRWGLGPMLHGTVTADGLARITAAFWAWANDRDDWAVEPMGATVLLTYLPTPTRFRLTVTEVTPLDDLRAAYIAALEAEWRADQAEDAAWAAYSNVEGTYPDFFPAWKALNAACAQMERTRIEAEAAYHAAVLAASEVC